MSAAVETMAYAGEVPWHGLGVRVNPNLSPFEMMVQAGVDWNVILADTFARVGRKEIPTGHRTLIRELDMKVLDVVGEDWHPTQNAQAFEFFADFIAKGNMEMHTAGSLLGGRVVWALAKVNNSSFTLFGQDRVESHMLFVNPHMYGKSIDVRFTPIRVVCNNTLNLALSSKDDNFVKVTHATKFDAAKVKEIMGIAEQKLETYEQMAAFLGSKRYNDQTVTKYMAEIFPSLSKREGGEKFMSKNATLALEAIDKQPGSEYAKGSWWQAFNTVSYMTDHVIGRSVDARLTSAWFGQNKGIKIKALNKAYQYAEAA